MNYHLDLSVNDLISWTDFYRQNGTNLTARREIYLIGKATWGGKKAPKPLFDLEYECMEYRKVLPQDEAGILVIFVGDSFEPLLLSIRAYRPQIVLAVFNHIYGSNVEKPLDLPSDLHPTPGEDQKERFQEWFNCLKEPHPIFKPVFIPRGQNRTGDIYQQLQTEFEDLRRNYSPTSYPLMWQRPTVIDITGSKKKFIAAAYELAGHYNYRVSYVDFDVYDQKQGTPYGFSCRIDEDLGNPYRKFYIHEWTDIKNLYERGLYEDTLEKLKTIDADFQGISTLQQFLAVCVEWGNGNYSGAEQLSKNLSDQLRCLLPTAITELTNPKVESSHSVLTMLTKLKISGKDWLDSPRGVLVYAQDEYSKIRKLAGDNDLSEEGLFSKRDYRAAFQRAYGLCEFLSDARKAINSGQPFRKSNLLPQGVLTGNEREGKFWENLTQFRNQLTHAYLPVPKEVAKTMLEIARLSIEEYRTNWATSVILHPEDRFDMPAWDLVKEQCQLDLPI